MHGKTLNLNATRTSLKLLHQLRMMKLIYPMDLILFLIFKIILNTSLKNMKIKLLHLVNKKNKENEINEEEEIIIPPEKRQQIIMT